MYQYLTVVYFVCLYCPFKNKHCVLLHSTVGVVKPNFNLISCFIFCLKMKRRTNCFMNVLYKLNSLSPKSSYVDEPLKTIHKAFHVEICFKLKPIECKRAYLLYIFNNLIVLWLKVLKFHQSYTL